MFAFIKGIIDEKNPQSVILETAGGVGYRISMPASSLSVIGQVGDSAKVYTSFIVREDAQELYGFATREERNIFEEMISVSGIGPKAGISILSTLSVSQLSMAIVTGDHKSIARAPGIGPKSAQRLILELQSKVKNEDLLTLQNVKGGEEVLAGSVQKDALEALQALGYLPAEASNAVKRVYKDDLTADQLVLLALRSMAQA